MVYCLCVRVCVCVVGVVWSFLVGKTVNVNVVDDGQKYVGMSFS